MPLNPPLCLEVSVSQGNTSTTIPPANVYGATLRINNFQAYTRNNTQARYTGTSIAAGMYLGTNGNSNGMMFRIQSIYGTATDNKVEVFLEDVGGSNKLIDTSGGVVGGGPASSLGYVFELNNEGLPLLTSVANPNVSPTFIDSILARFLYDKMGTANIQTAGSATIYARGTGKNLIEPGTGNQPYKRFVYVNGKLISNFGSTSTDRGLYLTILNAKDFSVYTKTTGTSVVSNTPARPSTTTTTTTPPTIVNGTTTTITTTTFPNGQQVVQTTVSTRYLEVQYNTTTTGPNETLATALSEITRDQIGILTSYREWEFAISSNRLTAIAARLGLAKLAYYSSGLAGGALPNGQPYAAIFYGIAGIGNNPVTLEQPRVIERLEPATALNGAAIPTIPATISTTITTDGVYSSLINAYTNSNYIGPIVKATSIYRPTGVTVRPFGSGTVDGLISWTNVYGSDSLFTTVQPDISRIGFFGGEYLASPKVVILVDAEIRMPGSGGDECIVRLRVVATDNESVWFEFPIALQRFSNNSFYAVRSDPGYARTHYVTNLASSISGDNAVKRNYKFAFSVYRSGDDAIYVQNLSILVLELSNTL